MMPNEERNSPIDFLPAESERSKTAADLDSELAQKVKQIAMFEEKIATAPPKTRRTFYLLAGTVATAVLLLLVWFAVTLLGGGGPQDVAEAYADAIVKKDYETAFDYFGELSEPLSEEQPSSEEIKEWMVVYYRTLYEMVAKEHGEVERVVTLAPQMQDDDHAEVVVVWHHTDADLAQRFRLELIDSQWLLTEMSDPFKGELDGDTFIIPQLSGEIDLADDSPIVMATPSAFTLAMQLQVTEEIGKQVTATVLEVEQSQSFDGGFVQFEDLPLGQYTVRLSAPGFEDHEIEVEARGDEPLPDVITATLGTPLALDPNNTLLLANGRAYYKLVTITSEGMITHWNQPISKLKGWSSDFKSIEFANDTGIGRIDAAGQITLEWNVPAEVQNSGTATYRPDLQEMAYIQHKDLFTLATEEAAEPVRWSKIGLFEEILGWFDNDTLLIQTLSSKQHVLRRDGSSYEFPEAYFSRDSLIFDREGWLRLVYHNNILYQPGRTVANKPMEFPRGSYFYGWTHDNNYLLVHSALEEPGGTSGLIGIDKDGKMTKIAPTFVSPRRNLLAWDIAPSSNKIALSWQPGRLYIGDAESETMETTNYSFEAYNMFWPTADTLIYVINQGNKIGTWRLSLGNEEQEAEKLFDYRAEYVTATPDGRLLLVANNTLWEYDGTDVPQVLGEEGSLQMGRDSYFVWLDQ